jgi:hypothetical protein
MSPLSWTETAKMTKSYTVPGLGIWGWFILRTYFYIWGPIKILYISVIIDNYYYHGYGFWESKSLSSVLCHYRFWRGALSLYSVSWCFLRIWQKCFCNTTVVFNHFDPNSHQFLVKLWMFLTHTAGRPKPWWWGTLVLRSLLSWHPCPCQWRWTQERETLRETNDVFVCWFCRLIIACISLINTKLS